MKTFNTILEFIFNKRLLYIIIRYLRNNISAFKQIFVNQLNNHPQRRWIFKVYSNLRWKIILKR